MGERAIGMVVMKMMEEGSLLVGDGGRGTGRVNSKEL